MKIIKSFRYDKGGLRRSTLTAVKEFYIGLGDDGHIYFKFVRETHAKDWYHHTESIKPLNIEEIILIADNFKKIMPFI